MIRSQILFGAALITVAIFSSLALPSELMSIVSTGLGIVGGMLIADGFDNWGSRA